MGYGAFPYIGSKGNLAEKIIGILPPHECFVEVFGGSGAILITQKNPSPIEIYNDLSSDLVNFMLQVRDNLSALQWYLSFTPYSRELYERWLKEWKQGNKPANDMERAARWFFLQCGAINQEFGTGWRHSKVKNMARDYYMHVDRLTEITRRMRNVQIEQKDFRELISIYDSEEVLFYLDPPYDFKASSASGTRYSFKFSEQDHRDLAVILSRIQGKAIVSYYPTPLVDSLYTGWNRINVDVMKGSGGVDEENKKEKATELLLCNYEPLPLFRSLEPGI